MGCGPDLSGCEPDLSGCGLDLSEVWTKSKWGKARI